MAGGDADADGVVEMIDLTSYWANDAGVAGYLNIDFNMDGEANNQDKDETWENANGKVSQIP